MNTPVRACRLTCTDEVFGKRRVRTVRVEVTDRMLIAGPRHLE
jgi:hypothetical protein